MDVDHAASPDSLYVRDGDDLGCGGVLTFTFDHPNPPVSLDIDINVL